MRVFPTPRTYVLSLSLALFLSTWLPTIHAHAAALQVDKERSVFAIVTHKAGIAKGQAHNHLVTAGSYSAKIEGQVGATAHAAFEIDLAANDLVVDDPNLQKQWYPRLEALGILNEAFADVAQKDRDKIRQSALGKSQLDAEKFPRIKARVAAITEKHGTLGEVGLTHEVMLVLEVHGRAVERPVSANVRWQDDQLRVEAVGIFQFTDFDIKPFSAFFGAVKNTNDFHLYVNLTATPEPSNPEP